MEESPLEALFSHGGDQSSETKRKRKNCGSSGVLAHIHAEVWRRKLEREEDRARKRTHDLLPLYAEVTYELASDVLSLEQWVQIHSAQTEHGSARYTAIVVTESDAGSTAHLVSAPNPFRVVAEQNIETRGEWRHIALVAGPFEDQATIDAIHAQWGAPCRSPKDRVAAAAAFMREARKPFILWCPPPDN